MGAATVGKRASARPNASSGSTAVSSFVSSSASSQIAFTSFEKVLISRRRRSRQRSSATDVNALQNANQELAEAVANIQRAIDQLQQQQALQTQALLNAIRGQWDAAQFGPQSVEAILVALNPGLQGKVNAIPFDPGR